MPFERPTLTEIVEQTQQDFVSRLGLTGALLRKSMVAVISRVVAGARHMLHGHLDFVSKQIFADQSEEEFLERQASLYGISKTAATFTQFQVEITGVDATIVTAGEVLVRADGVEYETDADVTIASGTATADVTALEAGSDPNVSVDLILSFQSPVTGADSACTVTAITSDGADQETTEELRIRLLEFLRTPPTGGSEADYIGWAKEVPGVTRAWVNPGELGAGTVVVRFVRDDDADPIPDSGEVADVQTKLDAERPVTAAVTAAAPIAVPINFTLHIDPDTSDIRAAVEAELTDLLRREAEPGGDILLSHIRTALGTATAPGTYTLASPSADVTAATAADLPTGGALVFT